MVSLAGFVEAGAFGNYNEILSSFHSEGGYALPNRFEVLILSPPKLTASGFDDNRSPYGWCWRTTTTCWS